MPRLSFPRQSTEWDCLPKAVESALLAIFGSRRVPLRALRAVYRHSIDRDDCTSKLAIDKMVSALAKVPEISVRRLRGERASASGVLAALQAGLAVVIPIWIECEGVWYRHAAGAVGHCGRRVRIADPYSSCRTVTLRSLGAAMDKGIFLPVALGKG